MTAQIESTAADSHTETDSTQDREMRCDNRPILDITPELMADAIGQREFGLHHHLADHPLLSLEALAELADALPEYAVERHEAEQPLLVPGGADDDVQGPASETVRNIERNKNWMVMWNIEQVAGYRSLLNEILGEVMPHLPAQERGVVRQEGFIFLSAPHSVTPVHFDPEHNFLLQIRGLKKFHVGRFPTSVWKHRELDRWSDGTDGGHRNLLEIPPESSVFSMRPGDAIYVYPWAPHWVINGPEVSISLSITFRTKRSESFELANLFNARLRRHGMSARPAGEFESVDRTKAAAVASVRWLRRRGRSQRGVRDLG